MSLRGLLNPKSIMAELLFHPTTERQINLVIARCPHAVLLHGSEGSGKLTTALHIISSTLGVSRLDNYPFFLHIDLDLASKTQISADQIRDIKQFLKRKTFGEQKIRRAVLISSADKMSDTAQNALLKSLEEPPQDTIIILTTDRKSSLLPTIVSRVQSLEIKPADSDESERYFGSRGYEPANIRKLHAMSGGRVGLLKSLLDNSADHPLVLAINDAKNILSQDIYSRLLAVEQFSKDREKAARLLDGLMCVLSGGLRVVTSKGDTESSRAYHLRSLTVMNARRSLDKNVNLKILLTDVLLNL